MALLRSDTEEERLEGLHQINERRRQIVGELIKLIEAPREGRENGDGWLEERSTRNITIECLGDYRAPEAVPALVKLLAPMPGETVSRALYLCPAGKALVEIGSPCVPTIIDLLSQDPVVDATRQELIVLHEIVGWGEGERQLKEAMSAAKDEKKRANLRDSLADFVKLKKDAE
jgi:HEAT repeat protein